ncbi:hypothetical protein N5J06_20070 [Ralstonia sp. CHL-2022]|uniref:Transmembrane protein n=1 Tax=Ralstonia mojiangensis TaxID=2953895 RepID=A0ABT2LEC4_9RALS|nr:hypothetical protein [Ralstonia mojiangensis]MCT7313277.1 hypothetical protein [Ralstonia mojiangensis]
MDKTGLDGNRDEHGKTSQVLQEGVRAVDAGAAGNEPASVTDPGTVSEVERQLRMSKRYLWAAMLMLLLGFQLRAFEQQEHIASAGVFYTAVVLAFLCNLNMRRAGVVGRTSPYVFVAAALTIIGFFPMLAMMGYTLFKAKSAPSV